jgi:hypothetical protein
VPTPATPVATDVLDRLRVVAAGQGGVFLPRQAREAGVSRAQLATLVRRGAWLAVRRGVIAERLWGDGDAPHAVSCAARLLVSDEGAVVSYASAGVLHGLPYIDVPAAPTLTVPRLDEVLHLDACCTSRLPADHRQVLGGLPVTTGERTVSDLLRTAGDRFAAQALADGARRHGISPGGVHEVLESCAGWPGVSQARTAWAHADGRRESPLESRCTVWFREGGLPEPEPQVLVSDGDGFWARVDFLFRSQRTVVEADGRLKYDDPRALWDEKRREDRLRELGFEVVRATWADGRDGGAELVLRVLRAFERAALRVA